MKDYKKILEGVVNIINTTEKSDIGFANICTYIGENCPELKESEDERIRKAIGYAIGQSTHSDGTLINGISSKKALAWLEKQGEKLPVGFYYVNSEGKKFYSDTFKYGDVILHVEKQGEQKPDKVEPKFKVKYAGGEYNVLEVKDIAGVTYYGIEDELNHIDYVKADSCEIISGYDIKESGLSFPTKPVMFSEQNPAWSEEDEKYWSIIIAEFSKCAGKSASKDEWMRCNDWLNNLRPQSRQEWSEEDEAAINDTIAILEILYSRANVSEKEICERCIDWLKSLHPQNHWKPSVDEIKAIEEALSLAKNCGEEYSFELRKLLEQLKKL